MGMLSMLIAAGAGTIIAALGGDAHLTRTGAGTTLIFVVGSDGSISVSGVGTMSPDTITGDFWFNPATAGIGANYWVRATVTAGSLSSGIAGTWASLATDQTWSKSQSVVGSSTVTLTIDIASDSGGSNIVATGSFTLTCEHFPGG